MLYEITLSALFTVSKGNGDVRVTRGNMVFLATPVGVEDNPSAAYFQDLAVNIYSKRTLRLEKRAIADLGVESSMFDRWI